MKPFVPASRIEFYFQRLSDIPRVSAHEQAASSYIASVAEELGLKHRRDDIGNVVVWKDAFSGYEASEPVLLQAHLDMVAAAAPGVAHDFTRDPLTLLEDDSGRIRADGTTLGSDDGYGCAYMLAILEDKALKHPPLTCLFTVQEENGCWGAKALDTSDILARRMIGLDVIGGDIEYTGTVSCYCSDLITVGKTFEMSAAAGEGLRVRLEGVRVTAQNEPHPEQGNAIKMLFRLLKRCQREGLAVRLCALQGGVAENANPVTCEAILCAENVSAVRLALTEEFVGMRAELGQEELRLALEPIEVAQALNEADTRRIVDAVYMMPSGVQAFSQPDKSMIATNNVGQISLQDGAFELIMSDRARDLNAKNGINQRIEILCGLLGLSMRVGTRYVPWTPPKHSPITELTSRLMLERYGHEMIRNVCPGGLEICDLLPKMPGLDSVMFAPIGAACHTPDEWMDRESFNRVYDFLTELLSRLR